MLLLHITQQQSSCCLGGGASDQTVCMARGLLLLLLHYKWQWYKILQPSLSWVNTWTAVWLLWYKNVSNAVNTLNLSRWEGTVNSRYWPWANNTLKYSQWEWTVHSRHLSILSNAANEREQLLNTISHWSILSNAANEREQLLNTIIHCMVNTLKCCQWEGTVTLIHAIGQYS